MFEVISGVFWVLVVIGFGFSSLIRLMFLLWIKIICENEREVSIIRERERESIVWARWIWFII